MLNFLNLLEITKKRWYFTSAKYNLIGEKYGSYHFDGLNRWFSRGYEVVGTGYLSNAMAERIRSFIQCSGDAIDGLGNLQKQEKTECQFTVKLKFEDLSFI
jgi:hypothetical protein